MNVRLRSHETLFRSQRKKQTKKLVSVEAAYNGVINVCSQANSK